MKNQKLKKWYDDVCLKYQAHDYAAKVYERLNDIIGFIAIIAAIIAGTQVIIDKDLEIWAIILGAFAIIAALSNAAVKFFGFNSRMKKHKDTSTACASLKYELESLLLDENKTYPPEIFDKIQKQLSDISTNAPLISAAIVRKANEIISKETFNEISECLSYDMKIIERWKVNNIGNWSVDTGSLQEIGENPARTYKCEPLELCEYKKSGKIYVTNEHIMTRGDKKIESKLQGEGIMNNNTGFIRYSVSDLDFSTYGNMVLNFTNRVEAKGFWVTANVKEANLLIGTVELKKI